jgi:alpha-beta hydrolase superfamily lysophospholipase
MLWTSATLVAVAAAVLASGWRWVQPWREPSSPDLDGIDAQDVCFPSLDGTRLRGLYLAGRENYATLILCHGYAKSLAEPWQIGLALNQAGYNIFLLDFRASGQSAGRYTTVGYKETWDLLAATRFVKDAYGRQPIGVLGISMGAAVAIVAAAQSPDIAAVAADSPFADLQSVLRRKVSDFVHLPWLAPLGWLSLRFGQWLAGFQAADVNPIDYVPSAWPGTRKRYGRPPAATTPRPAWIMRRNTSSGCCGSSTFICRGARPQHGPGRGVARLAP